MRILTFSHNKRFPAIVLCFILSALFILPITAHGAASHRTVRVGWYESPFNKTDESGRKSGYAYEYQQKIASYTGWKYEYVQKSWPELLEMLMQGKNDLMSDVSYTKERAEQMLFSMLPMGTEDYYIFVAPGNGEIRQDDYSTMNGKRVGINKGSVQVGFYREWAEENGVETQIVEMTEEVDEAIAMLSSGEIDMYVVLDAYLDSSLALPICKVGASDFFFAVSSSRPELLAELNAAMNCIQDENHYYNQQLYSKYIRTAGVNLYLNAEEKEWLAAHGTIRVGYQDNYLAFCAKDPSTGELTGALRDYLEYASDCLENARLDFKAVAYPTAEMAMEALKKGEIDCVFPINLTDYDGEINGFYITAPLMQTGVEIEYRFAVSRDNSELYSILTKTTGVAPDSAVNAALSYYFTEDAKVGFGDFIRENLAVFIAVIAVIAVVILLLVLRSIRSEHKASAGQKLIHATEIDELTGLYNRRYFYEYANRMHSEHPEKPMDAIALNIENFHSVNALNGRSFGDQVLRALGEEIRAALTGTEGIACRSEGDGFAIYLPHTEDCRPLPASEFEAVFVNNIKNGQLD